MASVEFYGTVLGLPCSVRYGKSPGAEFETGNLTLSVIESEAMGVKYQTNNHPIALHVDDVEAARPSWNRAASRSGRTRWTRACATWPSLPIRTATL